MCGWVRAWLSRALGQEYSDRSVSKGQSTCPKYRYLRSASGEPWEGTYLGIHLFFELLTFFFFFFSFQFSESSFLSPPLGERRSWMLNPTVVMNSSFAFSLPLVNCLRKKSQISHIA